ncbi:MULTISPECIES: DUF1659 domain-containing protein [Bacillus]|uniref:DUF1659 domain-containing protein n=1 Tax=Bacillus TaxID=1386 RepID=UPI000BB7E4D6|nr:MULTISPECIES: DUF1659 domain-containing protein [Bacillus]
MTQAFKENSQLRIVYFTGVDFDGNPLYKTKNYNNIKLEAEHSGLYEAAQAIIGLQVHSLDKIVRNDSSQLINL